MTLSPNEVYVVTWAATRPEPTNLALKAYRLMKQAEKEFDLFEDAVRRGEYGCDYESVAYTEDRDRIDGAYQAAIRRYEIIRQGLTCDCAEGGCRICNAYFYVTNAQEDK